MQQSLAQAPRLRGLHRRQHLLQVRDIARPGPRTQHALGGLEVHLHRSQRRTVHRTHQQCRSQFIADIRLMRQLHLVGLRGSERQLAPIMHQQREAHTRLRVDTLHTGLTKGFGPGGQSHPLVVQETLGPLHCGERPIGIRQRRKARRQLRNRMQMPLNHFRITPLKPQIQRRSGSPLHCRGLGYFRICVDTNGWLPMGLWNNLYCATPSAQFGDRGSIRQNRHRPAREIEE